MVKEDLRQVVKDLDVEMRSYSPSETLHHSQASHLSTVSDRDSQVIASLSSTKHWNERSGENQRVHGRREQA